MNIFYIDKASLQTEIRIQNLEEVSSHKVERGNAFSDIILKYEKDKYDLVLIDHAIENGIECIKYINNIHPKQKILSVSGAGFCIHDSCETCVQSHQARRLNNPTTINNILRMSEGFSKYNCDHYK